MNPELPTILVIDDAPANLELMDALLSGHYRVKVASNAERGLRIARERPVPDLILLDVVMPGVDGYELCRQLKAEVLTAAIPVIFLTARSDVADEQRGLELGAVDYIAKPISAPILLARVRNHLTLKAAADFLRDRNVFLEAEVQRRTEEATQRAQEAQLSNEMTMVALASIAETRDNETGNHILRTQHYVRTLAEQVQFHPRFRHLLNERTIELFFKAAPLHDIGKVGIPDRILLKPGRLTPEEFEIMKGHTTLGHDAISKALQRVGGHMPVLEIARDIALSHQEKWDGSGYPNGLVGEAIPLSARLMAIADVYDALISQRVYKAAMTHEEAMAIMRDGRGTHFDPDLLDEFIRIEQAFREIAQRYLD